MNILEILSKFGIETENAAAEPFINEEDGEEYKVWKISLPGKTYVLKEAKSDEIDNYKNYVSKAGNGVPEFFGSVDSDGKEYLLTDFFPGKSLRICNHDDLVKALDALISVQNSFWGKEETDFSKSRFKRSVERRKKRGEYLFDDEIKLAYEKFMESFNIFPKTLCHDDMLPFNVLADEEKAVIIDWESADILPYPVSLARFIAHGEEDENSFFYMTEKDKKFAVDYYYSNFAKEKGIAFDDFIKAMDLFILYEFCEWVMVGEKYNSKDSERYIKYLELAKQKAKEINIRY